jgi:hypothetical protein
MPVRRRAVNAWTAVASVALGSFPVALACSSGSAGGSAAVAGSPSNQGGTAASGASSGGSNATGGAGGSVQGGGVGPGGTATGGNAGGLGTGGSAGGVGGAGGTGGSTSAGASSGGMSGADPCDTPPWRPLKVTAALGEHIHGKAGLDTRAKTMLGKLVVDIGVNSGGYSSFLAKRGYHSIGAPCGACPAPDLAGDRTRVGKCREGEFATTAASVKATLTSLQGQYPEEDWGYFLTQDGSNVRWSEVAITGISHGATTAALSGRIGACMWRIVSRSGPRDNTCGLGGGQCSAPLSTPSYDANCPDANVASWLDQPSKTPMDRFYALVGMQDSQCGDIMFDMHRTKYLGVPTIFDTAGAVLTDTHQFFSSTQGHYDFLAAPGGAMNTPAVLEIAFGIPPENRNPNF